MLKSRILAIAAVLLAVPVASAGSIPLAWDAVSGATGYRVYYGTSSGSYVDSVDVGNATQTSLGQLQNCTQYYVAVKAYNGSGESPAYSNEVSGWARPSFDPAPAVVAVQGSQLVLDIDGANFDGQATITLDASAVPLDSEGQPLLRFETIDVVACDRIQALVTVEPTAAGFQAMQIGQLPLGLTVQNPDGVFNSESLQLDVAFNLSRADINRDSLRSLDRVDGDDLASFARAWATSMGDSEFEFDCDMNGDTAIDGEDLALLATVFGRCRAGQSWSADACL